MKNFLKQCANVCSIIAVFPFYLFYRAECLVIDKNLAFQGMGQLFSLLPGMTGNYLRKAFYYLALKRCSLDCCICFGTLFSNSQAQVGKNVYIGANCMLGEVVLRDDVLLGSNVDILDGGRQHCFDDIDIPIRKQARVSQKVTIGEDTWIGNGSLVMQSIGKKCVIGAGSVVSRQVEDYSVVAGNPARILRKRK